MIIEGVEDKKHIKLSLKQVLIGKYTALHREKTTLDYERVELSVSICRYVHLVVKWLTHIKTLWLFFVAV